MGLLRREPVRAAVLTIVAGLLALLVSVGVIDDGTSASIGAAVTAVVLALGEAARATVSPVEPPVRDLEFAEPAPVVATDDLDFPPD